MWVLINGLSKPSLEAPGYVTKILRARKWTSLLTNINCISENTDFDMENDLGFFSTLSIAFLFVICSLTPNYEYYFSAFSPFCYFFFLLFQLSAFKPLKALYSKFERLKISGRTRAGHKLGVPG